MPPAFATEPRSSGATEPRSLWRRLRLALRPPRRLRLLRPGVYVIVGALLLGLATLNTGNNLLYLLLGALLGMIALSGWLSESTLRDVHVRRSLPVAVVAGESVRIDYTITNEA